MSEDLQQRLCRVIATHMGCDGEDYREVLEKASRAASAVILDVGLIAEWASTHGATQSVTTEVAAKYKAKGWPERFGVATRYVTQWKDIEVTHA